MKQDKVTHAWVSLITTPREHDDPEAEPEEFRQLAAPALDSMQSMASETFIHTSKGDESMRDGEQSHVGIAWSLFEGLEADIGSTRWRRN